ncbi:MAG: hypothetical protein UW83_C0035G0004 [Parcubacteria group bacterium GW2011_GWD1_44_9]|nr:MAG: hypothetical protein UW83_C0035G0004 [Parcubacteria group bacterium GW2011_GWD1_44_9]
MKPMRNKRYSSHISALLLTLVFVFVMSGFIFPQTAHAQPVVEASIVNPLTIANVIQRVWNFGTNALLLPVSWLSILILQLATLLTGLAGMILNYVVKFTIVDMAKNLKDIGAIDIAWKAIRDVANMGFIFVLLYAAIQTILGIGSNTQKLIVNIVVVAILINFSLFFTKVVIDSSNVLSTFFYDAIAPGSLTDTSLNTGLSSQLMRPLKLTSLWNNKDIEVLDSKKTITIGVMGTIVSLIAAFVFFAVAIMFVIRFVVLIFVLILSPLAFIGYILPQLKKYKDDWIEALLGQAFFAPIYFMLTWIVIIISTGILESPAGRIMESGAFATAFGGAVGADGNALPPPLSSIAILMNFIIMIVFLIASLIIAKQWANRAGHGVPGLTKWATGLAGGATLGMAGRIGRGTIGRAGAAVGESEWLKKKADSGSMAARLALATGRKTGSASFDVRGMKASNILEAGQAQKGGFIELKKKQAEREEKFAASLAPSAETEAKIKDEYKKASGAYENAKKAWGNESEEARKAKKYMDEVKQRKDRLLGNKEEVDEEIKNREQEKQRRIEDAKQSEELKAAETEEKSAYDTVSRLDAEAKSAVGEVRETKIAELGAAKTKLEELKKKAGEARKIVQSQIRATTDTYDRQKKALEKDMIKPAGEIRKGKFADAVEKSAWASFRGYNYDAAAKIRKGKKSAKELIDEALKETGEKSAETKEEKPPVVPETPPTPTP